METNFDVLKGKTLVEIVGEEKSDELLFKCSDGTSFKMYHSQDCCETVRLEEVVGDLSDLLNSPITEAEEVNNPDHNPDQDYYESHTWTFYKLSTMKGSVTLRWLGESNGYYSESVSFEEIK